MVTICNESVLIGLPVDGVGDALPLVAVAAAPHVVARLGLVAGEGNAVLSCLDAVGSLIPGDGKPAYSIQRCYMIQILLTLR